MPEVSVCIDYHVFRCECPSCQKEVEGLLPKVSHGFECPECQETIRVVDCYVYDPMYFRYVTKKLKPVKIQGPTIQIRCSGCNHVFTATNVHDKETRICPKCGKASEIKRVAGMCEGCRNGFERHVQKETHVVKCHVCGNYQPV